MDNNKRNFFRFDDEVYLEIFPVPDEIPADQIEKYMHTLPNACEFETLSQLTLLEGGFLKQINGIKEGNTLEAIKLLNKKIHSIAEGFIGSRSMHHAHPNQLVNISEGGIRFFSLDHYTTQKNLIIKLVLFPSYTSLLLPAQVIYAEPETKNDQHGYWTGANFIHIKETNADLLFKHIMQKQLQQRREQREKKT